MRDRAKRPTRPVTRRPAAGGSGSTTRTSAPGPPGRLTGRAVILGVVLVALALSYVFPLRVYLNQQADISQLRTSQAAQRDHIAALEAEADRWQDEEFVRIQARKRRFFVEPGEIPIIIVWEEEQAEAGGEADPATADPPPWWDTLWSSVEAADRAAVADGSPDGGRPGEPDR